MTADAEQVVALDAAEITRRVEALLPEIDGRADEIAEARRLPRDLVDELKTAGVFRMSMPKAWGGSALPLRTRCASWSRWRTPIRVSAGAR